ncbi:hypothetical protein WBG78_17130 [Chryseolinea sp. T2]|uniref:hypothetical protein n=1 Tax=Chryseolinea sp. T2 TaxID=3129255 RepID=UPI00307836AE
MPIIENNPAVAGASGTLGNTLVYKQYNGKTIIANKGKKREKLSEKQEEQVGRFKQATKYAKRELQKPEMKSLYAKGINKAKFIMSAYNVAIADFLTPPEIKEIDTKDYTGEAGQLIRVRATDDFKVKSVTITLADAEGEVIETGEAQERGKKGLWRYTTNIRRLAVKGTVVTAVAKDYPGNTTTQVFTML